MEFEWDENKNKANWKKHKVDFKEAESVFEDERMITIFDEYNSDEEERFRAIGLSRKLREITVCHCSRNDDEVTRIISARRATKPEIKLYERGF